MSVHHYHYYYDLNNTLLRKAKWDYEGVGVKQVIKQITGSL